MAAVAREATKKVGSSCILLPNQGLYKAKEELVSLK